MVTIFKMAVEKGKAIICPEKKKKKKKKRLLNDFCFKSYKLEHVEVLNCSEVIFYFNHLKQGCVV